MRREMDLAAPVRLQRLEVDVVTERAALAGLRAEWSALHDASGASLFTSWEWLYPWVQRLASDVRLRVLTARDGTGRLVGLLPLGAQVVRAFGRPVRRWFFLGESHVGSDYLDVVALPALREEVTRTFLRFLQGLQGEWDVLDLLDMEEGTPTLALLREAFGIDAYERETRERYLCPYEEFIPGESFDAFLKRTGRRDNYLRRRKWLEKQEGWRIEKTQAPGELALPMSAFFGLHAARWQEDGGSQGIQGPSTEAFHRDATQLMAERGRLWLYTMWMGSTPLASVYGLVHRDTFIYYQSGYDPAWRNKSVGLVLVGETFRDAMASGLKAYDFLRGTETYKSDWVSRQRRTVALRLYPKGGQGRWLTRQEEGAKAARNLVKRVLPADLTERIRRLRRRMASF